MKYARCGSYAEFKLAYPFSENSIDFQRYGHSFELNVGVRVSIIRTKPSGIIPGSTRKRQSGAESESRSRLESLVITDSDT